MKVEETEFLIDVYDDDGEFRISYDKQEQAILTECYNVPYEKFEKAMKTLKKEIRRHKKESFQLNF